MSARIVPDRLAHVVLRTRQFEQMLEWWRDLLEADVVFHNEFIGFLSYDDEHHRVAIVRPPDLGAPVEGCSGLDHVAFTYAGLADLVATYERLRGIGLKPTWVVNHGPTLSLYYTDPDGNQVELQIDRFATNDEATRFLQSPAFARHPIGHSVDFEDLVRRFHDGEDPAVLTSYRYEAENSDISNSRDPVEVVKNFFASFGPTHEDMVATARRLCHDDLSWASAGYDPPRVTSLEQLVRDLEKARTSKGIAGFEFELVHVAADGEHVLTERFDHSFDDTGKLVHSYRVMGTLRVRDGRIASVRDYFYDTREFAEHYLPEERDTR